MGGSDHTHMDFRAGQTTQAGWDLAQVTAAPVSLEVFRVWLCSPEGGLENTEGNGRNRACIMTRDKGK